MISLGQITYLKKVIGIFIILISISNQLQANDLKESYLILGKEFDRSGQHFLAYQNYTSAYLLEDDPKEALGIGLKALSSCLTLNRIEEGSWLVDSMSKKDNKPDYYTTIMSLFYLKTHDLKKAKKSLESISSQKSDKVNLLYSYYYFLNDEYNKSLSFIQKTTANFPMRQEKVDISTALGNPPKTNFKSPLLASGISMVVPGLGQIYSGLTFDGINALITNGLFGSTAAVLWLYEMDRDPSERNYSLPVISTVVFSFFYITNIYNAYNSANRYNNYHKNKYYNGIFENFQLLINNNSLFIGYGEVF